MDKWFIIVGVAMTVALILTLEPKFDRLDDGSFICWYNSDDLHKHRKYITLWKRRKD